MAGWVHFLCFNAEDNLHAFTGFAEDHRESPGSGLTEREGAERKRRGESERDRKERKRRSDGRRHTERDRGRERC